MPSFPYIAMVKELLTLAAKESELVALTKAHNRVLAIDLCANISNPPYDQSLRDGYALARSEGEQYQLIDGEAFAGNSRCYELKPGQACRIFTGGLLPKGAVTVAAQEDCQEHAGELMVQFSSNRYLQREGSVRSSGSMIAPAGTIVTAEYLAEFAAAGVTELAVYKKTRVALLATGSELRFVEEGVARGEKIASNSYLLKALFTQYGAEVEDYGRCRDEKVALRRSVATICRESTVDIILTTGGMGPGRYDLVLNTFLDLGGELACKELPLSPGKSLLLGRIMGKLFIALPGSPGAIRPLFTELVARALLSLQGLDYLERVERELPLAEELSLPSRAETALYAASMVWHKSVLQLVPARRVIAPDCYMLIPPNSKYFSAGSVQTIHLTRSPFA